jgi:hypothetical protein
MPTAMDDRIAEVEEIIVADEDLGGCQRPLLTRMWNPVFGCMG